MNEVVNETVVKKYYHWVKQRVQVMARTRFGEDLPDEDLLTQVRSAVWLAEQQFRGTTVTEQDLLRRTHSIFKKTSDEMHAYRVEALANYNKAVEEFIVPVPVYSDISNAPDPLDIFAENQYEACIAAVQLKDILAALLEEWDNPDLALGYLLNTGMDFSVPTLLDLYQPDENVGANATRKRAWSLLGECRPYAESVMRERFTGVTELFEDRG